MSSCKHCSDSLLKGMKEPIRIEHEIFSGSKGIQLVGQQLVGLWEDWLLVNDNVSKILLLTQMMKEQMSNRNSNEIFKSYHSNKKDRMQQRF